MVMGFWGKKIGMTQIFVDDKVVPVTAIDVADWFVTQVKTRDRDGYNAVQVGLRKKKYASENFSPTWLKDLDKYFSHVREIRVQELDASIKTGQKVTFFENVKEGDGVSVTGISKGCGFAGVVRRHNFGGPPATHGHTMGNKPGSIGNLVKSGRVIKGKKLPGHMGAKQRMVAGLTIVKVVPESNCVLVSGAVPGKAGSYVFVQKS